MSKWNLVCTCKYKTTFHLKENKQSKNVKIHNIPDRHKCPKPTYHINIWSKSSSIIQVKDESAPVLTWIWKCWCSLYATSIDWKGPETMEAYELLDLPCLEDLGSLHQPSPRSSVGSYHSSSFPSSCSWPLLQQWRWASSLPPTLIGLPSSLAALQVVPLFSATRGEA